MNYRDLILESYLEDNDYEAYDEEYDDAYDEYDEDEEYEAYDEEYDDDEALEAYLEGYYYALESLDDRRADGSVKYYSYNKKGKQGAEVTRNVDADGRVYYTNAKGKRLKDGVSVKAAINKGKGEFGVGTVTRSKAAIQKDIKDTGNRVASGASKNTGIANASRSQGNISKTAETARNAEFAAKNREDNLKRQHRAEKKELQNRLARANQEITNSREYGFKSGERSGYEKGNTAGTKKGRAQGAAVAGGAALAVAGGVAAAKAIKLDKEYKAYTAAGGKLSKKEWLSKGKPSPSVVEKAVAKIKHEAYNEIADMVYEDALNEGYELAIAELCAEEDYE